MGPAGRRSHRVLTEQKAWDRRLGGTCVTVGPASRRSHRVLNEQKAHRTAATCGLFVIHSSCREKGTGTLIRGHCGCRLRRDPAGPVPLRRAQDQWRSRTAPGVLPGAGRFGRLSPLPVCAPPDARPGHPRVAPGHRCAAQQIQQFTLHHVGRRQPGPDVGDQHLLRLGGDRGPGGPGMGCSLLVPGTTIHETPAFLGEGFMGVRGVGPRKGMRTLSRPYRPVVGVCRCCTSRDGQPLWNRPAETNDAAERPEKALDRVDGVVNGPSGRAGHPPFGLPRGRKDVQREREPEPFQAWR